MSFNIESIVVPEHCAGLRTDVVLAQLIPQFSRSQLSKWLQNGLITLDQKQYKPKEKILGGELIEIRQIPNHKNENQIAENIPLDIIYEDDDLLIINKPAGLVVHPGAGNHQHTLMNALLYHNNQAQTLPRAGIVHRLDKDTTGLMIVAKQLESYTKLVRQMQARTIQRSYVALVVGEMISGGTIHTFYGRHPHHRLKMAVCKSGKEAITEFRLRKKYNGFTLLDVRLLTGRTHQIRVHMAHNRHPIVGDPLYNPHKCYSSSLPESLKSVLNKFTRQALHACSLTLLHPITEQQLTFEAPMPHDLTELIHALN